MENFYPQINLVFMWEYVYHNSMVALKNYNTETSDACWQLVTKAHYISNSSSTT